MSDDFDFGPGLRGLMRQAVAHEAGQPVRDETQALRSALDAATTGLRHIAESEGRDLGLRSVARAALDEAEAWVSSLGSDVKTCGAWGGCPLPSGHNMGQADVPENHKGSRRTT